MPSRSWPRILPGPLTRAAADTLNAVAGEVRKVVNGLTSSRHLQVTEDSSGYHLTENTYEPHYVKITGRYGNGYAWERLFPDEFGQWVVKDPPESGRANPNPGLKEPAYELNGNTGVPMGTVVQLWPGFKSADHGREWLFQYCCTPSPAFGSGIGSGFSGGPGFPGSGPIDCPQVGVFCGQCQVAPQFWSVTMAGIGIGSCGGCATFNGAWTLGYVSGCTWATQGVTDPCARNKGNVGGIWLASLTYNQFTQLWTLTFGTDSSAAVYTQTVPNWNCFGANTMNLQGSPGGTCTGWPSTVTVSPDCNFGGGGGASVCGCASMPLRWNLTMSGWGVGTGTCTDCTAANGTFLLNYAYVPNGTWFGDIPGFTCKPLNNGTPFGPAVLSLTCSTIQLTLPSVGGTLVAQWTLQGTWSCNGTNTFVGGSSSSAYCSAAPTTVTIAPA